MISKYLKQAAVWEGSLIHVSVCGNGSKKGKGGQTRNWKSKFKNTGKRTARCLSVQELLKSTFLGPRKWICGRAWNYKFPRPSIRCRFRIWNRKQSIIFNTIWGVLKSRKNKLVFVFGAGPCGEVKNIHHGCRFRYIFRLSCFQHTQRVPKTRCLLLDFCLIQEYIQIIETYCTTANHDVSSTPVRFYKAYGMQQRTVSSPKECTKEQEVAPLSMHNNICATLNIYKTVSTEILMP